MRAVRLLLVLAASVTPVLLAACGGEASSEPHVTLTDDGCMYEGDETPPATRVFSADVENKSSKPGYVVLVKIDEGGTFAELEAYVKQKQRLEEGLDMRGLPTFTTPLARVDTGAGGSGVLVADLRPDRYAFLCAHDFVPSTSVFLVTPPLDVASSVGG